MNLRKLGVFTLTFVVASRSGQVPAPVKAGDPAPTLNWTKTVASGSGGPQNLVGQTTALLFLPLVSANEQTLVEWNKLVEQFAQKPVNFF